MVLIPVLVAPSLENGKKSIFIKILTYVRSVISGFESFVMVVAWLDSTQCTQKGLTLIRCFTV